MSGDDRARLGGRATRSVVFDPDRIRARVRELADEISAAYRPEDRLLVIGLLKGSFLFMADLVREIRLPLQVDFLVASSYGGATESSGEVRLHHEPTADLAGRAVLLVEDIVDSGTTLRALIPRLERQGPVRVDVCALLHKRLPGAELEPRWVGFDAPNAFLVGYGLDHAEDFRHLPYIASL
jgi:hypoxanthine phosphoribosyltransferase